MRTALSLAATLAVALALAAPASAATDFGATPEAQRAAGIALGREAYTYGFPLLEVLRVRAQNTSVTIPDGRGNAPVNTFSHARTFAGPKDRTVVAPNVDTLYSIAHLDLGHEPVVLKVPPTRGRYWVFELLDPYTNVIGYLGRRLNGSKGGTWAITWTGAAQKARLPKGVRRFASSYRRVWVVGRTLTTGGGDLAAARAIQDRYVLAPLSRFGRRSTEPRAKVIRRRPTKVPAATGLAFLDALGRGLADNPPPARDKAILARLRTAGIGPGLEPAKAGLPQPVLDGLAAGVDAAKAELPVTTRGEIIVQALADKGWYVPGPRTGAWGTDYTRRAQAALVGLGINTPAEAAYPVALTDSDGQALTGAHRYRLTFAPGKAPPTSAFWSLTMYDGDGYLVANASKAYAVGDSHPPLRKRADGSIVIAIQRTRPADAAVNWLPAPPAAFRLNLRLYIPRAPVLSGAWMPPGIERLD